MASSTVDMPTRSAPRCGASGSRRASHSAGRAAPRRRPRPAPGSAPPGQGAQPGRVQVGEVGEPGWVALGWRGPAQRRAPGEVEVVTDQHRLPDLVARADPARRVGQHDDLAARPPPRYARRAPRRAGVPLVQVGPAEEHQARQVPGRPPTGPWRSGPPTVVGGKPPRRHRDRDLRGRASRQRVCGRGPAGAEHHGDVVPGLAGQLGEPRALRPRPGTGRWPGGAGEP